MNHRWRYNQVYEIVFCLLRISFFVKGINCAGPFNLAYNLVKFPYTYFVYHAPLGIFSCTKLCDKRSKLLLLTQFTPS